MWVSVVFGCFPSCQFCDSGFRLLSHLPPISKPHEKKPNEGLDVDDLALIDFELNLHALFTFQAQALLSRSLILLGISAFGSLLARSLGCPVRSGS